MTGETLLPCPWCGGNLCLEEGFWQHDNESDCWFRGIRVEDNDRCRRWWNTRALAPALDRVIEAVEAGSLSAESVERFRIQISGAYWTDEEMLADFVAALRALRAEQSADAGGERGGG